MTMIMMKWLIINQKINYIEDHLGVIIGIIIVLIWIIGLIESMILILELIGIIGIIEIIRIIYIKEGNCEFIQFYYFLF